MHAAVYSALSWLWSYNQFIMEKKRDAIYLYFVMVFFIDIGAKRLSRS